jgi:tetratricopeptide (TPR) repeat protein
MDLQPDPGTRQLLPGGIDPLQLVPAHEFDRLVMVLTHAEQAWVFCLYNTALMRDAIVEALRARLAPLPVYEFTLSAERPNPRAYLQQLPPDAVNRRAVICFYDAWRAFDANFLGYLDIQREQFWMAPHALVFWIRESDRAEIARHAPNFFSRNSGVFDFQVAIPAQAQTLRSASAAMPATWDSLAERDRQERLYLGLLAEYEADEESDQATIADLLGKLATIWYYSDRFAEAEAAQRRRLAIVQQLGDHVREADSLLAIGEIWRMRYEHMAALDYYDQALGLFRAVGDRLGEANVLKAQGDVLAFLDRRDEALARYDQALGLFRAVGARLGEANVLLSMGDMLRASQRHAEAWENYQQVYALYGNIGDRYSLARVLYRMGDWFAEQNKPQEAKAKYEAAIELWRSIGLEDQVDSILLPRLRQVVQK